MIDPRHKAPRHGLPTRMVDRVLARTDNRCTVRKVLTCNEVLGHRTTGILAARFPDSLLMEAMVQAALPLTAGSRDTPGPSGAEGEPVGMLVAIHAFRIHRRVGPGDVLRIISSLGARLGDLVRVSSRAETADGAGTVAEGEFTISTGPVPRAAPPAERPGGIA